MRPALPGDFQCGEAVERRQGIICENQVKTALLERCDEISLSFNPRNFAGDTFALEGFLNQLRVPGVILKIQNPQLRFHFELGFLMLPGGGSLITAQKTPSSLMAFTNSWKSTGFTT